MTDTGIVAQMLVRNEVDVIRGTLANLKFHGINTICILDGCSDDGTLEAIHEWGQYNQDVRVDLYMQPDPGDKFADHLRNALIEMSARYNPKWIVSTDADERWHTSPLAAIEAAEQAGANYIRALVPQFWMTSWDVRHGLQNEPQDVDVELRRRWYSWGHTGVFIWRWNDLHFYPQDVQKRTPETGGGDRRAYGPIMPVCKHYCFRSLPQAIRRTEERKQRGGKKYFGKYFLTPIIVDEAEAGLYYLDEREQWCVQPNHEALYRYWDNVCGRLSERVKQWGQP